MEHLADLLYADDVTLLAHSNGELQQLCNALPEFCTDMDMVVNLSKTEVVVFKLNLRREIAQPVITYQGQMLTVSETLKYLGLPIDAKTGFTRVCEYTAEKANKALGALYRRL